MTLLKKVSFGDDGVQITQSQLSLAGKTSFMCLATSEDNELTQQSDTLLKFDLDLNLVSHIKLRGALQLSSIYPITEIKAAFFDNRGRESECLFVIDLKTRSIQLAHTLSSIQNSPNFLQESDSGRLFNLETRDSKLIKVYFN